MSEFLPSLSSVLQNFVFLEYIYSLEGDEKWNENQRVNCNCLLFKPNESYVGQIVVENFLQS